MSANNPIESELLAHRNKLLGFVRSRVGDPQLAEDILHDSLIKALGAVDQLEDDDKVVAWFYQLLRNTIIDRQRKEQTKEKYHDQFAREADDVVQPDDRETVCQCFRDLLPGLKDEYQELIEKVELTDAESAEVAEELGITRNNLKVRRHRARQQLKERLEARCGGCADAGCLDCTC